MTLTTSSSVPDTHQSLAQRGRWCFAAAIVGVLQGAVLLAWPEQVSDARFSFPLTAAGHVLAQATFFVQHLPLVVAVGSLAALPAVRSSRAARRALVTATAGLGLLAITELGAMAAATADNESNVAATVSGLYSVPVLLIGGGLTVAGIAMLRRAVLGALVSWTVLALGVFVFVGLTPALASGSFVAGRLAIMLWMVLFAVLGWGLAREPATA